MKLDLSLWLFPLIKSANNQIKRNEHHDAHLAKRISYGVKYLLSSTICLMNKEPNMIVKRWSEAESFTIFENHVYSHYKNLMFAGFFVALKLIATCNSYWHSLKIWIFLPG